MKWFTCIIHAPQHISPVQYFHTRAETSEQAEVNAFAWLRDEGGGAFSDMDVEYVFEGKLEPQPRNEVEPSPAGRKGEG